MRRPRTDNRICQIQGGKNNLPRKSVRRRTARRGYVCHTRRRALLAVAMAPNRVTPLLLLALALMSKALRPTGERYSYYSCMQYRAGTVPLRRLRTTVVLTLRSTSPAQSGTAPARRCQPCSRHTVSTKPRASRSRRLITAFSSQCSSLTSQMKTYLSSLPGTPDSAQKRCAVP